ncbi:Putative peptidoglycan binding domain-containing protein [Desulfonema magnum]|uniref:Peptidoglycan binding domain-containing protein n=1 Tax=Desulfonema magnum TaxID=45655 RepID=A0A975BJN1_9BACT|nr:Putative peptidoglycan binding domain-containing protein [Desulfonema magnum]
MAAFFIGISFYLTPEDKDNNGPVKVEPEKPPLSEKTPEEKDVGADKDKIDERVRYAQKILKSELFLYNGKVDGKLDEDTEIAIKNFQGQNRLKRTGFIDDETWAALKKAGNSPPAINSSRQ